MFVVCLTIGEAGWTPDQWGHSRFRTTLSASADSATNQKHLTAFMRSLLKASFSDLFLTFLFCINAVLLPKEEFIHVSSGD